MSYDEGKASIYESDREHALPPEEAALWLAEMRTYTPDGLLNRRLLDVGAGTGLLTIEMKRGGLNVVGLEPSQEMIKQGISRHPELGSEDFVQGYADQLGLFEKGTFDWIVSRQVLCHLGKPEEVFNVWRTWLKPNGHIVLVDGMWPKASWSNTDLAAQPLAAVSDVELVADMVRQAGFDVRRADLFTELNNARILRWPASRPRYIVIASKSG